MLIILFSVVTPSDVIQEPILEAVNSAFVIDSENAKLSEVNETPSSSLFLKVSESVYETNSKKIYTLNSTKSKDIISI